MRQSALALGVAAESLPPIEDDEDVDACVVWSINLPSVLAFLECDTQWRAVAGMGGLIWLGLDYTAVLATLNARPRADRRQHPTAKLFADIRLMEDTALAIRNEDRDDA